MHNLNAVFLMDPLESVNPLKDTTFALMCEAQKQGINIYYLNPEGINIIYDKSYFSVSPVKVYPSKQNFFEILAPIKLSTNQIDILFIRLDPPFNEKYLRCTWLLDHYKEKIFFINDPSGIRSAQEKTWLLQFNSIIPHTCISSNKNTLLSFAKQYNKVILKPYNQFGGHGVFAFSSHDTNLSVAIELLTCKESECCIIQPFIPEAEKGDKRILLLNGEPLGAIMRCHSEEDHRNNLFAGGVVKATELTTKDKEIINIIKPKLLKLGLYFVGIDILGDYLVEINVTSPTCIQEMESVYNKSLCQKVILFAKNNLMQKQ